MADPRRLGAPGYGNVGELTYKTCGHIGGSPGILHTTRLTSSNPKFKVIGSLAELFPPSKDYVPKATSQLWQERKVQTRWLLKSHPEASMAGPAFASLLNEDMQHFHKADEELASASLLTSGLITDQSDPSRVAGMTVLASVTGRTGELLRISRCNQSLWRWGGHDDGYLNLSVIDTEDTGDEVIWTSDALPITQIKFAASLDRHIPLRWLIVQKKSSTTILQPEYHRVPVAQDEREETISHRPLSRIKPNPLLSLTHRQTGGNSHADVTFIPSARGEPPRIGIVDDCGYWTIWNVLGKTTVAHSSLRVSLFRCGHMFEGSLTQIPREPVYAAEKRGIALASKVYAGEFWEPLGPDGCEPGFSLTRAQNLIFWSSDRMEIFNLGSGLFLPQLLGHGKKIPKTGDWILDVQPSPSNGSHVFILTLRNVIWVEIHEEWDTSGTMKQPSILAACPVIGNCGDKARIATSRIATNDESAVQVFLYSPSSQLFTVYLFSLSTQSGLPCWHHFVTALPTATNGILREIRLLQIQPAELKMSGNSASDAGPASQYSRSGVRFYQGNVLAEDLSVQYFIAASVDDAAAEVTLPTGRVGRSEVEQRRRWKKMRQQLLARIGTAFTVPDDMADAHLAFVATSAPRLNKIDSRKMSRRPQGSKVLGFRVDRLIAALQRFPLCLPHESAGRLSQALLDALHNEIGQGLAEGRLPLRTWQEVASNSAIAEQGVSMVDYGSVKSSIRRLFDQRSSEVVLQRSSRKFCRVDTVDALGYLTSLKEYFAGLWVGPISSLLPPAVEEQHRSWAAELAEESFMEHYGLMVQDIELSGRDDSAALEKTRDGLPRSMHLDSSQQGHRSAPSSPPSSHTAAAATAICLDPVFQRLRLLAPSLRPKVFEGAKSSSLLLYWPTDRGVDTSNYISSVAVTNDRQFDDARQRVQKMEAKRKAQSEKYKQPALVRRTKTPSEAQVASGWPPRERPDAGKPEVTMSSQPAPPSSQPGSPVTMSQPTLGPFGDRKKVKNMKKGKKKSGFR